MWLTKSESGEGEDLHVDGVWWRCWLKVLVDGDGVLTREYCELYIHVCRKYMVALLSPLSVDMLKVHLPT